jgi:hypothetical protein
VDGREMAESFAIMRMIARQNGLAGNDPWESAKIESGNFKMDFLFFFGYLIRPLLSANLPISTRMPSPPSTMPFP